MQERAQAFRVKIWPFILGDGCLLLFAGFIVFRSSKPLSSLELIVSSVCVFLGAWMAILPFLRNQTAMLEAEKLAGSQEAMTAWTNAQDLVKKVNEVTEQWQVIETTSQFSLKQAEEMGQKIGAEAKAFTEFLAQTQNSENQSLKLDLEKRQRSESEWLQMVVFILDHVFALYQAAVRSARGDLLAQIGHFQNTCRESARRVGLVVIEAKEGDIFDPNYHRIQEGTEEDQTGKIVASILAPGYRFQGQLLRPILVSIAPQNSGSPIDLIPTPEETPLTSPPQPSSPPVSPAEEPPSPESLLL